MLGKNLLWVAKQHGHSVEVMLRMYAAWIEGATDADIQAIKQAIEAGPAARTRTPRGKKIVINPLCPRNLAVVLPVENRGMT